MTNRAVAWGVLAVIVPIGLLVSIVAGSGASFVFFGSYALVGAYLAARRPGSPIGWLLLLTGVGLAMGSVVVPVTSDALLAGTADVPTQITAWLNAAGWAVAFVGFVGLALMFPDGHMPTGRWRRVWRVTLAASVVVALLICVHPIINVTVTDRPAGVDIANPIGVLRGSPLWDVVPTSNLLYPLTFVLFLIATTSLAARARGATGIARLQFRWFVTSIVVVAAALTTWAVATFILQFPADGLTLTLVILLSPSVPLAVAVAVLRYRLFAIDRLISRTIGWALVTGVLVAVFVGGVLALQALLDDVTQGETLAVAVSTLLAFALFQPVRQRLQRAVDQRFDRARYDAERIATAFAERLRDQVDLDALAAELQGTATRSVRPTSATVWLPARTPR